MKFKDFAEHFYDCGYRYMYELEFGQPDFAKKFEQCWKEFNEMNN